MYDPLIIDPTMTLGGKQAAFAASNSGMSLKLTHVSFGKGRYDPKGTETALKTPVGSKISLAGGTRPTQYQIRLLAAWRENLGGETPVTEIGYWAGNVLAFVWSELNASPAFTKTDGVPAVLFSDIAFDSVPAGSIDLTIDPAESVALAAISAHEGASNAHPQYVAHALFPDAQADMWMTVTGSANAIVLKTPLDVLTPAYKTGQAFRFKAAYSNTGAVTANVNSLGNKAVVKSGGNALTPGDLRVGAIYDLIYDGTRFQLAGGVGGGQFYIEYPFLATANQTVFNGAYTPGSEFVFVAGAKLAKTEYTATDGAKITLKTGVAAGTQVTLVSLSTFAVADTYSKGEYDSFAASLAQAKDKASTTLNRWMSPQRTHEAITSRSQVTPYDTTDGALLVPGSFGSGALTLAAVASLNTLTAGGTYGWGTTSTGAPMADYGEVLHMPGDTTAHATQLITSHYSNRVWLRRKTGGTWQTPVEIFHSGNQLALGTTAATGRSALQLGAAALLAKSDALYNALTGSTGEAATTAQLVGLRDRITPIANGGTGAGTASASLANLGGQPLHALLTAYVANAAYGLGATALNYITDVDDARLGNGWYATSTVITTGGTMPLANKYGVLVVNSRNSLQTSVGRVHQKWYSTDVAHGCVEYSRVYTYGNNTWTPWVQVATTDSPEFLGIPLAPTAALGTNTRQISTMEALQAAINATGFGRYSMTSGAVNIDTLDSNGSYYLSYTATGTFPTGYASMGLAMLLHEQGSTGSAKQTLTHRDHDRTWVRNKTSSVWKAWREEAFTDSPALLGEPTAPTATDGQKDLQIANMTALFAATRGRGLGQCADLRTTIYVTGTPTDVLGTGLNMGLADGYVLGVPGMPATNAWGTLHVVGGWTNVSSAINATSREFHYAEKRFVQKAATATTWGPWVELASAGDNVNINSLIDVLLKGTIGLSGALTSNYNDTTLVPGANYRSSGVAITPKIRLTDNAGNQGCTLALQGYSYSTYDFAPNIVGTRSFGAPGAHGPVLTGRSAFSLLGAASDGTQYQQLGRIDFYTAEDTKPTSSAGEVRVLTTPAGSTNPSIAAIFGSDSKFTAYGQGVFRAGVDVTGNLGVTGELLAGYRMGIIRANGVPYTTYARSDVTEPPTANTQIMLIQAKVGSTTTNFDSGRALGALNVWFTPAGGGLASVAARNATALVTAEIMFDGDQALTYVKNGDFQTNNGFIAAGVATFKALTTFIGQTIFSAAVRMNAKLEVFNDASSTVVDTTNAGIFLGNNLNNGEGGLTIANYAPAITLVDRTTNSPNLRIRGDGGYIRFDADDGAGGAWNLNQAQFGPTGHLSLGAGGGSNSRLLTLGVNTAGNGNLTGTTQVAAMAYHNVGKDATSRGIGFGVESTIGDGTTTWTCPDWVDFWANSGGVNAGTTVTIASRFRGYDYSNVNVLTAFAFDGRMTARAGVNRWNLYMQGTAPNYIRGQTIIGGTDTTLPAAGVSLAVKGTASVVGTLDVEGAMSVSGISLFGSSARVNQYLDLGHQNTVAGNRQITFYSGADTTVTATVTASGTTLAGSTLALNAGKVTMTASLEVTGPLKATGAATLASTLDVAGAAALASTLNVAGAAIFDTTLKAKGAATFDTTLNATGATALGSTLSVADVATLGSGLNVAGAAVFDTTLKATGAATLSSTLNVGGAATFNTTLRAIGAVTLSSTLKATGAATFDTTLKATGAVTLSTTLNVGGAAAFAAAATFAAGVSITGALTGAQGATFASTVTRKGGGTVGFNAYRDNSAVNSFYQAQTTAGSVYFGNADGTTFAVNAEASMTSAWAWFRNGSAAVNGSFSAASVAAAGAISAGSSLSVGTTIYSASNITSDGSIGAAGNVTANATVSAGAHVTAGQNVTAGGSITATGAVQAGSFYTPGVATLGGVTCSGTVGAVNLTASNNITSLNAIIAADAVYSNNGKSWLAADANIYGSCWGGHLSAYLGNNYTQRGNIGFDIANWAGGTGGLGTYALMTNRTGFAQNPGHLVAGANLTYANTEDSVRNGGSPGVGTWRCMGTASEATNDRGTTLFLRVA